MSVLNLNSDQPAPGTLDFIDRRLILLTQQGLPLTSRPYNDIAAELGLSAAEVMQRLQSMQNCGVIRRMAAVPNHYALGYRANAMTVWDVDDMEVDDLGRQVGALEFVSHAYRRPRVLPDWPFNLFAMVHGRCEKDVKPMISCIAEILGDRCRRFDVLYSSKILKKQGLRLSLQLNEGS